MSVEEDLARDLESLIQAVEKHQGQRLSEDERNRIAREFRQRQSRHPLSYWLRFSLRTLFVALTLICIRLGYEANLVRNRSVARREIVATGGKFIVSISVMGYPPRTIRKGYGSDYELPYVRRLFGDQTSPVILFDREPNDEDLKRASYFPESYLLGPPTKPATDQPTATKP